jgi:N-acetylmuramoyl-L-alanine amidase
MNRYRVDVFRLPIRIVFSVFVLVCSFTASSRGQENTVRVVFDQEPQRNTVIGTFRAKSVLYASLTDLAQVFALTPAENRGVGKMELKQGPYRIKVAGGNPFIVVIDQAQRQSVYQLTANVIFAANAFFVPLQSFVPYFGLVFNKSARFDEATGMLHVGAGAPATGADIATVILEPKNNGMLIRLPLRKKVDDFESWLRQDGWLYVTLVDVKADIKAINALKGTGIVKDIVAIQSPTAVQLTFKLSGKIAATEILRDEGSHDLLLTIRTPDVPHKTPQPQVERKPERETTAELPDRKKRWDLDLIVLDPGHGGRDPGTIGVSGVREKDIALAVALKLGKLITADMPGVKVVYTRATDVFVPLYRRGQIANEAGGKLFVSIHCNSTQRKPSPMRGFAVYLLRPGRTEEAVAIAEQENAVIELEEGYANRYQELTDENFILVTMAQSAYVKSSEVLAGLGQKEMKYIAGLPNRGVLQAGFYVLVGAAMPNILLETAYLSNREDERFLKSVAGQQKIAEAVFRAVKKYRTEYEKLLSSE